VDTPSGRIVSLSSGRQPLAVVEVDAGIACERCASGRGCGAGLFAGSVSSTRIEAIVPQGMSIGQGDRVSIDLAPRNLLLAAVIVYGWPLAGAATGALVAYLAAWQDAAAAVLALLGAALGMLAARRRLANRECLRAFTPTVARRLPTSADLA